jgi:hypothetical protein
LQNLDVICSFDDGSDEVTCASFNPVNPCLFAFADVSGSVGLRAIDRSLDAGLVGSAQADVPVNCMGAGSKFVTTFEDCLCNSIAEWSCDGKLLALGCLNGEVMSSTALELERCFKRC